MNLLVDSSVWLWILGTRVLPAFAEYLDSARTKHRILTTGMVKLEVMVGADSWNEFLELQLHFSSLAEVKVNSESWDEAGRLNMRMRAKGFNLKAPDLLIAAVALENDLTLVHADRDFEYLARHEGLKTESLLHLVK